jgi:hypothetical protein
MRGRLFQRDKIEMSSSAAQKDRATTGHGEKLSRKCNAAITALLTQPTLADAAASVGISETTLWRWLQRDDFRLKLRQAQETVFDGALKNLQSLTSEAVICLQRNLRCKRPSVQVQAARTILHFSLKSRELFDLETRISELESRIQERENFSKAQVDEA